MPSTVDEPLHSVMMLLVGLIAVLTIARALRRSEILVGSALLAGTVAELMKSSWVIETVADASTGRLVWRVLVQALCLLAMVLLFEALRSSLWGVLWDSRPLLRWLGLVVAVTAGMAGLALVAPGDPERIEDSGGLIPAVYLLSFAIPVLVIAGVSVMLVWQNRRIASWSLWSAAVVVAAFGLDAGTLAGTYIFSDRTFGRGDGGVLWLALIVGGALVLAGTLRRPPVTSAEAREIRIFSLWMHVSLKAGFCDPAQTLRSWKSAGRPLAWIYVVRSCIDLIAAESARQGTPKVVSSLDELEQRAEELNLPAGRLSDLSRDLS